MPVNLFINLDGALSGQMITLNKDAGLTVDDKLEAAFNPPMAYFIIAGAVFLIASVIALLVLL